MAQAFDNRNFISSKQQAFCSVVSSSSSSLRPNTTRTLIETSPLRQSLTRPSYSPLFHEENGFNRPMDNQKSSISSLPLNDSIYHQRQQPMRDDYLKFLSEKQSSDTKPPPPARIPRIASTTNNNYIYRTDVLPQHSPNEIKTNTTYLNATQLYITQLSSQADPPTPPPRRPLHPPAIPPRNSGTNHQKNSVIIHDFNSSTSPRVIFRSPVISSSVKKNDFNGNEFLEHPFKSLCIDNNNHDIRETTNESNIREYYGECCKCGETITSLDDPCDILGQLYHSSCAICVQCGRSVKNKHFFIQDELYCEEDFLYTGFHETLEQCVGCGHLITDTILQAFGQSYHLTCFKCSKCSICLDGLPFMKDENRNLFCVHDYHITYGPRCDKCLNPICPENGSNETVRIISMDKTFHVRCYQCEDCSTQLGNEEDHRCYPLGDTLLCEECCHRRLISQNKF
ncbi:unnamed protein product [Rotaria magnacalcarata]|uniref:LIM zinc-binding domain-containing protein n=1 Tax=Rotaria magnacalcarata TaxID=392030 RepID=A0A819FAK7_9BILA|nr:unnamed protein product [Rotaria magnacalcarata]CAF3865366.1 unnamed protein product [Rotaria magnacalcarata]